MGDRLQNLEAATKAIERAAGAIVSKSSMYETAAWGKEDEADFLNQVLKIETHLTASSLLRKLLGIEQLLGRVRTGKYDPRNIDIDILLYNHHIINLPHLIVPHPRMTQRRFVLEPLDEIAPDFTHPILQESIHQLLLVCTDPLDVKKFSL